MQEYVTQRCNRLFTGFLSIAQCDRLKLQLARLLGPLRKRQCCQAGHSTALQSFITRHRPHLTSCLLSSAKCRRLKLPAATLVPPLRVRRRVPAGALCSSRAAGSGTVRPPSAAPAAPPAVPATWLALPRARRAAQADGQKPDTYGDAKPPGPGSRLSGGWNLPQG